MPRIKGKKFEYQANDKIDDLRWNMRRAGISTKEQADFLHCSVQNLNAHYRNRSFSAKQYLSLEGLYTEKTGNGES